MMTTTSGYRVISATHWVVRLCFVARSALQLVGAINLSTPIHKSPAYQSTISTISIHCLRIYIYALCCGRQAPFWQMQMFTKSHDVWKDHTWINTIVRPPALFLMYVQLKYTPFRTTVVICKHLIYTLSPTYIIFVFDDFCLSYVFTTWNNYYITN